MTGKDDSRAHDGRSKIDRYKWTVQDKPGRFQQIPKDQLRLDARYQRGEKDKVREMASDWSWVACGAITVSLRGNDFFVIDGKQRTLAANRRSDITSMPCMVFDAEGEKTEAGAFVQANTFRKGVDAITKHVAGVIAGFPGDVELKECCDILGIEISDADSPNTLRCVYAAKDALASLGKEDFTLVARVVRDISTAEGHAINKILLDAITFIHGRVGDGLRDRKLVARLINKGMTDLTKAAHNSAGYHGKSNRQTWAMGMIDLVNKGLAEDKRFTIREGGKGGAKGEATP